MTIKKILITMFLLSIAITAGCLSKESVSSTPATDISPPTGDNDLTSQALVGETPTPTPDTGTTNPSLNKVGQETTAVAIDWQAKMNADAQNNKAYAEGIRFLTGQNKALIPIGVKEATLTGFTGRIPISVLLTDISVDRKKWIVSGYIENQGSTAIKAAAVFFTTTDKEYMPIDTVEIRILNNINVLTTGYGDLQEVKPGQKLSFESAPVSNEYGSNKAYLERQKTATFLAVEYR